MQSGTTNGLHVGNGKRPRVLIVEDEPFTCKLWAINLRSKGLGVLEAPDGLRGLARARSEQPDLVPLMWCCLDSTASSWPRRWARTSTRAGSQHDLPQRPSRSRRRSSRIRARRCRLSERVLRPSVGRVVVAGVLGSVRTRRSPTHRLIEGGRVTEVPIPLSHTPSAHTRPAGGRCRLHCADRARRPVSPAGGLAIRLGARGEVAGHSLSVQAPWVLPSRSWPSDISRPPPGPLRTAGPACSQPQGCYSFSPKP